MNTVKTTSIHYFALWALIGVTASGQALNPIPAQSLGSLNVPRTAEEMVIPTAQTLNLIEGREFLSPQAVAVDTSATEPILYVADTGNKRVLAFKNPGNEWALQRADFVIGQRDLFSSFPNRPGLGSPSYNSGLNDPVSVAVDRQGNLFVLDFSNHRILRYPKPREQSGVITADLVIGQPNLSSRNPNQATATTAPPRADTLKFGTGFPGVEFAAIAFDPDGNLWVTDNGNHRVLRYPGAEVSGSSNTTTPRTISADYVLGQTDFVTATPNPARTALASAATDLLNRLKLRFGSALAFDSAGNLYVADDLGRVLFWRKGSGFSSDNRGRAADRILGLFVPQTADQVVPFNDYGLTARANGNVYAFGPKALVVIDDRLFVSDSLANRVVRYSHPSQWPAETTTFPSPQMAGVAGQPDFLSGRSNRGALEPAADTLSFPGGLAYDSRTRDLYVVDVGNNRVLVHPVAEGSFGVSPARAVIGQTGFEFRAPNFIEGREFGNSFIDFQVSATSAIRIPVGPHTVIDYTSSPPRLYVADTANNRVLGFADARRVSAGTKADIVIGQVDSFRNLINSPGNSDQTPTDTGLYQPTAVAVDSSGDLFVADMGNGRVLRFPRPFDQTESVRRANLVIGQRDFTSRDFQPTERTLARPVSIAFTGNDSLVVADIATHRVLLFARGDFTNGVHASRVVGQFDFNSSEPGSTENKLTYPLQIAVDADDNLYVADYGNNRIQVFYRVSAIGDGNGVDATNSIRVANATLVGVTASKRRSQFWMIDGGLGTNPGRAIRIPDRDLFFLTGTLNADATITTASPRALALDERDNPLILDGVGRITFHYPQLSVVNWANGFPRVAPGMIGTLRVSGVQLNGSGTEVNGPTVPLEMDDLVVTAAGYAAPIIQVNSDEARIIIPKQTPGTGNAEFLVRRPSTGEIVAHSLVNMTSVSPGIITQPPAAPLAPALAFNEDGGQNSTGNRARIGSTLTLSLTGYGYFDSLPEDGTASSADVPSRESLRVLLFTPANVPTQLSESEIISSALDPERPGVWKLTIRVPDRIPVTGDYWVGVSYKNANSYLTPVNPTPAGQVRPVVFLTR